MTFKTMTSPVGALTLIANEDGLAAVLWESDDPKRLRPLALAKNHPLLLEAERQLNEYFSGRRRQFTVAVRLAGTPFQNEVWQALATIPFGETRSYAEIARQIGRPRATRAVGAAIGRNPLSIIIPCHRVIGSNGELTGFAGGLEIKSTLLKLEARNRNLSAEGADTSLSSCAA